MTTVLGVFFLVLSLIALVAIARFLISAAPYVFRGWRGRISLWWVRKAHRLP